MVDFSKEFDATSNISAGIVTTGKSYNITKIDLLKFLINQNNLHGLYITINAPCTTVGKVLMQNNIDVSKLYFIDVMEKENLVETEHGKACLGNSNPMNLTVLEINVKKVLKGHEEINFVLLDSLTTLLIYNNMNVILRFIHSLKNNIESLGKYLIVILVEDEETKELIPHLSQLLEKMVYS